MKTKHPAAYVRFEKYESSDQWYIQTEIGDGLFADYGIPVSDDVVALWKAAPDLLEACEEARRYINYQDCYCYGKLGEQCWTCKTIDMLSSAIDKAKGTDD